MKAGKFSFLVLAFFNAKTNTAPTLAKRYLMEVTFLNYRWENFLTENKTS